MKKFMHFSFILLSFLFVISFGSTRVQAVENKTIINLESGKNRLDLGEEFTVDLKLKDLEECNSVDTVIEYNSSNLKLISVEASMDFKIIRKKPLTDKIKITSILKNDIHGLYHDVVKLKFKTIKEGTSDIKVTGARIGSKNNKIRSLMPNESNTVSLNILDMEGQAIKGINSGNAQVENYTDLGFNEVNSENIKDVTNYLKSHSYNNGQDVRDAYRSYENKKEVLARVCSGIASVDDYKILNIEGITDENLVKINKNIVSQYNSKLRGNDYLTVKIAKLQDYVDGVIEEFEDYVLSGSAVKVSDNVVRLVSAVYQSTGSISLNRAINSTKGFIVKFDYYIGGGSGADGIVVSLSNTKYTLGGTGGGLGFNGNYGIEFDQYINPCDPGYKHIAFIQGSISNHVISRSTSKTNDAAWHNAFIKYVPGNIELYVDDDLIIDYNGLNLNPEIYIGISAATGDCTDNHLVRNVKIHNSINDL